MPEQIFYLPLSSFPHRLKKEYDLGQGFRLMRFPREVAEEYRLFGHGYFKRHFGDRLLKEIQSGYCLEYIWDAPRFKSEQEMVYKLEDPAITFLIAMRIVKPTPAGFKAIFHQPPITDGLPFDLVEYRMPGHVLGRPKDVEPFTEEDTAAARRYFNRILKLLKNEYRYRRIFNTLRFFDLAFRSGNVDSRLIYFSIALEVLYKPLKGRITREMCARIGGFLAAGEAERREIEHRVLEIINFKARVIHGDMTYFDIAQPQQVVLVQDLEKFVRLTLQKILDDDEQVERFASLRAREPYLSRWRARPGAVAR